jgi:PAS domain S-box-containing protein
MDAAAQLHEKMVAMNEALMLGSVRQHELTEAADSLNVQLQKEITERKQAEESLRAAGERFRFMAESMPQKIFTARANGEVDYFNQQWMEFTGLTFEQIKDWGWKQFIHPDDVEENIHRWQHSIDTGEPFEFEHRFRRSDGVYRWHLSRAFPMRDAEGRITMWIGSNTDIEDQKRTEETLRESETQVRALFETAEAARLSAEAAKTRAETATRAKDDFLAALSHELRTPLNPALLLATSLADDAALPPRVRADIDVIAKSIALQAQLIDDMLDITRITSGKLRLDLQPIDAHNVLRQAYEILRTDVQERQVELTLDLAAPHNCIKADAVRVQQIFWNVLKNAVKFTPPGGTITVRTRNPPDREGMLAVEITDTGIGIEPGMLGKVFDAFIQEEHDGAHRFGGIGLGLAITRRLVEVQNGRIRAESAGRNRGTTFHIELPLEAPELCATDELPPVASRPAPPAKARRILLVEDHEQTRSTLVQLLERRGHSVVGVATAAAAREIAATSEFDLVISDLGLPDGDGHALMAELRDAHGVPGIALSGYGMEEDLEHSRLSGFFTHLTKPLDIHALESAIAAAPQTRSAL